MLIHKITETISLEVINEGQDSTGSAIRNYFKQIYEIHAEAFSEELRIAKSCDRGEESEDQFFDRLCALHDEEDQMWILVIKTGAGKVGDEGKISKKKVIGFAQGCKYKDSWYGVNIAVLKKYRGIGYGSLMMYYGQLHAAKDNVFKVTATADARQKKLVKYYERHGARVFEGQRIGSPTSKRSALIRLVKQFDLKVAKREYKSAVEFVQDKNVEKRSRTRRRLWLKRASAAGVVIGWILGKVIKF
jgi:ribosomal protein S18 acetylase RimI-like enzyme